MTLLSAKVELLPMYTVERLNEIVIAEINPDVKICVYNQGGNEIFLNWLHRICKNAPVELRIELLYPFKHDFTLLKEAIQSNPNFSKIGFINPPPEIMEIELARLFQSEILPDDSLKKINDYLGHRKLSTSPHHYKVAITDLYFTLIHQPEPNLEGMIESIQLFLNTPIIEHPRIHDLDFISKWLEIISILASQKPAETILLLSKELWGKNISFLSEIFSWIFLKTNVIPLDQLHRNEKHIIPTLFSSDNIKYIKALMKTLFETLFNYSLTETLLIFKNDIHVRIENFNDPKKWYGLKLTKYFFEFYKETQSISKIVFSKLVNVESNEDLEIILTSEFFIKLFISNKNEFYDYLEVFKNISARNKEALSLISQFINHSMHVCESKSTVKILSEFLLILQENHSPLQKLMDLAGHKDNIDGIKNAVTLLNDEQLKLFFKIKVSSFEPIKQICLSVLIQSQGQHLNHFIKNKIKKEQNTIIDNLKTFESIIEFLRNTHDHDNQMIILNYQASTVSPGFLHNQQSGMGKLKTKLNKLFKTLNSAAQESLLNIEDPHPFIVDIISNNLCTKSIKAIS